MYLLVCYSEKLVKCLEGKGGYEEKQGVRGEIHEIFFNVNTRIKEMMKIIVCRRQEFCDVTHFGASPPCALHVNENVI